MMMVFWKYSNNVVLNREADWNGFHIHLSIRSMLIDPH